MIGHRPRQGSLSLVAIVGSQVFILLANCVFFYGRSKPGCDPGGTHFDPKKSAGGVPRGVRFFPYNGPGAIGLYSDTPDRNSETCAKG